LFQEKIDTFICVHRRDVDYLLELALRAYQANFLPKGKLIFISNDLPYLQQFVERLDLDRGAVFTSDSDWLSKQELELPGWYKQQVIKLRAYQFCETRNFCNLGADTILLQPLTLDDLVCNGTPILYYTHHWPLNKHYLYEKQRVKHVAQILGVQPVRARRYVDFINDLFCFNRDYLSQLNTDLTQVYGEDSYYTLLRNLNTSSDQNKFGEWTLYSVYLLDCLNLPLLLRNTQAGFLYQVHSHLLLRFFQYNTKVVHFVAKDFKVEEIKREIQNHGLSLAKFL
jgi:hypothetical protein